jgi:hypothetical protein
MANAASLDTIYFHNVRAKTQGALQHFLREQTRYPLHSVNGQSCRLICTVLEETMDIVRDAINTSVKMNGDDPRGETVRLKLEQKTAHIQALYGTMQPQQAELRPETGRP